MLRKFEPGSYILKFEQKGNYGVRFCRRDVYNITHDFNAIEEVYFDFIDMPVSVPVEIRAGASTTVDLFIFDLELDHMEEWRS